MKKAMYLCLALLGCCGAFGWLIQYGAVNLGGLTGLSQLVRELCHVPIGITSTIANIILLAIVKRRYGTRTAVAGIVTMTCFSFGVDLFLKLRIPMLDIPFLLPVMAMIGGASIGLLVKHGGSTGGSDYLSLLISEKLHVSMGVVSATFNLSIVLLSSILFKSSNLIRSLLATFILNLSIDLSVGSTPQFIEWLKRHVFTFPLPGDDVAECF